MPRKLFAVAALSAVVLLAGCSGTESDDAANEIVRTTTVIAGAGVVGVERDTTKACPTPSLPDQGEGSTRQVTHAGGESTVPADPTRIVVLSTQALDTVCAVGLWERVVGAATLPGAQPQPSYLGTGVLLIPSVGTVGAPDIAKIAELDPDVILGSTVPDKAVAEQLSNIAPTVYDSVDGGWKRQFGVGAAGLGRGGAAIKAVEDYQVAARDVGAALASEQTQASIVRFTADSISVQGPGSFTGQVLADAGVRRPPYQREGSFDLAADDLKRAEGDIIYVSFAGDDGKNHGIDVMESDEWEDLGATKDKRVFAVDDTIWSGSGLVAARAILTDLSGSLNGYVSG